MNPVSQAKGNCVTDFAVGVTHAGELKMDAVLSDLTANGALRALTSIPTLYCLDTNSRNAVKTPTQLQFWWLT